MIKPILNTEEEEDEDDDDDDDGDFVAYLEEKFQDLSEGQELLPLKAFLAWDEIEDIIADEFLTEKEIIGIFEDITGADKKGCDFEQFLEINDTIDNSV